MKLILIILLVASSWIGFGQSTHQKHDTLSYKLGDWIDTLNGGDIYFCTLWSDNGDFKVEYYATISDSNTLFCRAFRSNQLYAQGMFLLIQSNSGKMCWIQTGIWTYFKSDGQIDTIEHYQNGVFREFDTETVYKVIYEP
jgi:hypothetical protein